MGKHNNAVRRPSRIGFDQRAVIQGCLAARMTVTRTACAIGFSVSAVSRELRRNSSLREETAGPECPDLKRRLVCNGCRKKAFCRYTQRVYDCERAEEMSRLRMSVPRQAPGETPEEMAEIDAIVTPGVRMGQSLHHIYVANPSLASICSERTIRRLCYQRRLTVGPGELRMYVVYRHSN
jgi:hypothetical protein